MKSVMALIALSLACGMLPAQPPAHASDNDATGGGVEAPWDLTRQLDALTATARRLGPMVDQANPQNWRRPAGANDYYPQWKGAVSEIKYLIGSAEALEKHPEQLTAALDTYFRMETMDASVGSLVEGIRKYDTPALANRVRETLSQNANNREKLKQYILQLAQSQQEELKVMDQEAQRCRNILNAQPVRRTGKRTNR
jgi:hypothetical protein